MKLYTLEYDCNSPVVQQINVPTNTDYKVGVKFVKNGYSISPLSENVTLGTLSADLQKTNGYVTFTISADDNASFVNEKLVVNEGYAHGVTQLSALGLNNTGRNISITTNPIMIDVPDEMVGQPLGNAADMYNIWVNSTSETPVEEVWAENKESLLDRQTKYGARYCTIAKTTYNGQTVRLGIPNRNSYNESYLADWKDKIGQCVYVLNEAGTAVLGYLNVSDVKLNKGDKIYVCAQANWMNNRYGYAGI